MAKPAPLRIDRILPRADAKKSPMLSAAEAQGVIKVAFLAGEADGRIADEEQETFRALAQGLKKLTGDDPQMSDAKLEAMLDGWSAALGKKGVDVCLSEAARALERPLAKDLAFKAAVAMSLADLDRSDDEGDFVDKLMDALGLTDEQADTLSGDVYAALEEEGD